VGVVAPHGEHDAYSSTRLENELAVLIDGGLGVVVDLSEASFIDLQTLSVLLATVTARRRSSWGSPSYCRPRAPSTCTAARRHRVEAAFAVDESLPEASAAARTGASGAGRLHAAW
jgi:hypothetical protein